MPYGQDAKVGLAFQNSHGTVVSAVSSFYSMPFLSESVSPDVPELLSENMEGRFDEGEAYIGPRNVAGTITNESQPGTLGVMLKAMMGNPTTTPNSVAAGIIYTHVFKPRTSDWDAYAVNIPMTMYKNLADGGTVPIYKNLVATRLQLDIANGEFLTAAMDLTGGAVDAKVSSAALGTEATGKKWTWDVTSLSLGGSANLDFGAISVVIDEQASPRWTLKTSRDPDRVKRDARRQIRVSGTVKFVDQTEYDIFLANTTQALIMTLTGATEIRSGFYDVLKIDIPSFKYLAYPVNFADPSELQVSFEGKAEYNTGSGTSIQLSLTNTYSAL